MILVGFSESTVGNGSECDVLDLSSEDIAAIDAAGAKGEKKANANTMVKRVAIGAIACAAVFSACNFFGIRMM